MKPNLFSKIKTFFQDLIAKVIPSMTKENTTTDSHRRTRIWNQEFFQTLRKGIVMGFGFMLGMFGTGLLLAVPSGVSSPWASGDKLTAAGLNALRTAIEGIPNWTKNGTSAYYTDGNVGIGTSSPGYPLTMNVTTSSHPFYLKNNTSSYYSGLILYNDQGQASIISQNGGNYSPWGGANTLNIGTVTNNNLNFLQNDTVRMTINSNGNVGIGTNSPTKTLEVYNATNSSYLGIYTPDHPTNTAGVTLGANDSNRWTIFQNNSSNSRFLTIWRNHSGVGGKAGTVMLMDDNGNVSVGNAPTYRFDVTDTTNNIVFRLEGSNGICTHAPQSGTETVSCSSDEKLKKDIKDASPVIEDILKFRIRDYLIKNTNTPMTGVIAQEVQKVFPELVHKNKKGILMVDQFNHWKLVKAIQELHNKFIHENTSLSSRYASLLDDHNSLKKETNELSLRLRSLTENHSTISEENKDLKQKLSLDELKIQSLEKQLTELRKENTDFKLSVMQQLKEIQENRYAKK